jgi:hypothetical protein
LIERKRRRQKTRLATDFTDFHRLKNGKRQWLGCRIKSGFLTLTCHPISHRLTQIWKSSEASEYGIKKKGQKSNQGNTDTVSPYNVRIRQEYGNV